MDGTPQKCIVLTPENPNKEKRPLVVALHSWGGTYKQKVAAYGPPALAKGFYAIFPDYRGPNTGNPQATGSKFAVQDIVDAVNYMCEKYPIDKKRIYIAGASGGGHMALLMAGKHPEIWAAVSAWCPIADLDAWYKQDPKSKYAKDISQAIGAIPGLNEESDAEYRDRSPYYCISNAKDVPFQIYHGTKDKLISIEQIDRLVEKMKKADMKVEYIRTDGGHALNPQQMLDFVEKHQRVD